MKVIFQEKIAQAYVGGWITQKKSIWAEVINHFVGITYQVCKTIALLYSISIIPYCGSLF